MAALSIAVRSMRAVPPVPRQIIQCFPMPCAALPTLARNLAMHTNKPLVCHRFRPSIPTLNRYFSSTRANTKNWRDTRPTSSMTGGGMDARAADDISEQLEGEECLGRVLSIQSHVVRGYVGNKSAVFPLQQLGMEVDVVNSVHFSNHTGYPSFSGKHLRLTGDDVHNLLDGLEENDLLRDAYTHFLTGYIGSPELLRAIVRVQQRLRDAQTDKLVYVCDPVMGDLNELYVAPEMVELYRDCVVPVADVLTPNQFECELLTDSKLETVADALKACRKLHERGPSVVVITSFHEHGHANAQDPQDVVVIGSKRVGTAGDCSYEQCELRLPWIDSYYTGTGDLFAALLLAWLHRLPNDFKRALENVVSTIQAVLKITLKLGGRNCELKLIQSRHVIANPPKLFSARTLHPVESE